MSFMDYLACADVREIDRFKYDVSDKYRAKDMKRELFEFLSVLR